MALIAPTAAASFADNFACNRLGIAMAAMTRIMATTIKSSISEKPLLQRMATPSYQADRRLNTVFRAVRLPSRLLHNKSLVTSGEQSQYIVVATPSHKKRAANVTFAAPGLYPPPGTLPNLKLLVERVERQDARFGGRAHARWVDANHGIFLSTEAANTSLVHRQRPRQNRITGSDTGEPDWYSRLLTVN